MDHWRRHVSNLSANIVYVTNNGYSFVLICFCVGNRLKSTAVKQAPVAAIRASAKFNAAPQTEIPSNYRHIFPEFLPDPSPDYRQPMREKLERIDMLNRR